MPNFVLDHECPHLRLRVLDVGTSHLEQGRVRGSQTYPFAQGQLHRSSRRLDEANETYRDRGVRASPQSRVFLFLPALRIRMSRNEAQATKGADSVTWIGRVK
jgi:hypothetical protein